MNGAPLAQGGGQPGNLQSSQSQSSMTCSPQDAGVLSTDKPRGSAQLELMRRTLGNLMSPSEDSEDCGEAGPRLSPPMQLPLPLPMLHPGSSNPESLTYMRPRGATITTSQQQLVMQPHFPEDLMHQAAPLPPHRPVAAAAAPAGGRRKTSSGGGSNKRAASDLLAELPCKSNRRSQRQSTDCNGNPFYKNVTWDAARARYRATVWVNKQRKHIGYFRTCEAAARAADQAQIVFFGDKADLNFPAADYEPGSESAAAVEQVIAQGMNQNVKRQKPVARMVAKGRRGRGRSSAGGAAPTTTSSQEGPAALAPPPPPLPPPAAGPAGDVDAVSALQGMDTQGLRAYLHHMLQPPSDDVDQPMQEGRSPGSEGGAGQAHMHPAGAGSAAAASSPASEALCVGTTDMACVWSGLATRAELAASPTQPMHAHSALTGASEGASHPLSSQTSGATHPAALLQQGPASTGSQQPRGIAVAGLPHPGSSPSDTSSKPLLLTGVPCAGAPDCGLLQVPHAQLGLAGGCVGGDDAPGSDVKDLHQALDDLELPSPAARMLLDAVPEQLPMSRGGAASMTGSLPGAAVGGVATLHAGAAGHAGLGVLVDGPKAAMQLTSPLMLPVQDEADIGLDLFDELGALGQAAAAAGAECPCSPGREEGGDELGQALRQQQQQQQPCGSLSGGSHAGACQQDSMTGSEAMGPACHGPSTCTPPCLYGSCGGGMSAQTRAGSGCYGSAMQHSHGEGSLGGGTSTTTAHTTYAWPRGTSSRMNSAYMMGPAGYCVPSNGGPMGGSMWGAWGSEYYAPMVPPMQAYAGPKYPSIYHAATTQGMSCMVPTYPPMVGMAAEQRTLMHGGGGRGGLGGASSELVRHEQYPGVYYNPRSGMFRAYVSQLLPDGRRKKVKAGEYLTAEEAAHARDSCLMSAQAAYAHASFPADAYLAGLQGPSSRATSSGAPTSHHVSGGHAGASGSMGPTISTGMQGFQSGYGGSMGPAQGHPSVTTSGPMYCSGAAAAASSYLGQATVTTISQQ